MLLCSAAAAAAAASAAAAGEARIQRAQKMLLRSMLQSVSARLQPFATTPLAMTSALTTSLAASLAARSMKVVSALQKRCDKCRIVRRGKIHYVYCSADPKHKARTGSKARRRQGVS